MNLRQGKSNKIKYLKKVKKRIKYFGVEIMMFTGSQLTFIDFIFEINSKICC